MAYTKTASYDKAQRFARRKFRVNQMVKTSNPDAHRLVVNRSNMATYVQLVSPNGDVLLTASDKTNKGTGVEKAFALWESVAKTVSTKKLDKIVFDRNGYKYHGKIKSVADGLRAGGLSL